ncbi:unnamed protein product [Nezara viridula]|uniref:Uncharacterized protein n=1 Tax=Nezara viridula TaxID=85310 RepID=A0A9P0HED1_NEZVI|nr:unnamed protein product [Nezara viridula]
MEDTESINEWVARIQDLASHCLLYCFVRDWGGGAGAGGGALGLSSSTLLLKNFFGFTDVGDVEPELKPEQQEASAPEDWPAPPMRSSRSVPWLPHPKAVTD